VLISRFNGQVLTYKPNKKHSNHEVFFFAGNERWKVIVRITKRGKVYAALACYAILRDNQKLFDSKWKK
jgi:hypothetical protein